MISKRYFQKFAHPEGQEKVNQLSTYSSVWKQYFFFSYPILTQKITFSKPIEGEVLKKNSIFESLIQFEDSLFVNGVDKPLKQLLKIKEYKEYLEKKEILSPNQSAQLLKKSHKIASQKYGSNSWLAYLLIVEIELSEVQTIPQDQAIPKMVKIMEELKRRNLLNTLQGAYFLDELTMLYIQNNEVEKVAEILQLALRIRKKFVRSPSIQLAKHEYMCSLSYSIQLMFDQGLKSLENAVHQVYISKEDLDTSFLSVMTVACNQLSLMYRSKSRGEEALKVLQTCWDFLEEKEVANDIFRMRLKLFIGQHYKQLGQNEEAIKELSQAAKICESKLGEINSYPEIIGEMAECYLGLTDYPLTLETVNKAIKLELQINGSVSLTLPTLYLCQASALFATGRVSESKEAAQNCITSTKKVFSEDNPAFQGILSQYNYFMQVTGLDRQ